MNLDSIAKNFNKKSKIYKKVFESEEGKYILKDIYRFCRINHPSYVEGYQDKTSFNEGAKSFAYYVKNILNQSDADVDQFIAEYNKASNYNALKRSK